MAPFPKEACHHLLGFWKESPFYASMRWVCMPATCLDQEVRWAWCFLVLSPLSMNQEAKTPYWPVLLRHLFFSSNAIAASMMMQFPLSSQACLSMRRWHINHHPHALLNQTQTRLSCGMCVEFRAAAGSIVLRNWYLWLVHLSNYDLLGFCALGRGEDMPWLLVEVKVMDCVFRRYWLRALEAVKCTAAWCQFGKMGSREDHTHGWGLSTGGMGVTEDGFSKWKTLVH